jgi:uncharacterized protein with HEPN domain
MSPSGPELLRHILDEAEYLLDRSQGLSREEFLRDETLRRAFVRSLEIIGEATKHITPEDRAELPDLVWRGMAGMRVRLIHGYFGVDYELVWDVVQNKIPELRERLRGVVG